MIIGITGNSGTGKSTVASILADLIDAEIIDADKIVREEQKEGKTYYNKIVEAFGTNILQKNKEIDRKNIASIIYENDKKRAKINDITNQYIVPIIIEKAKKTKKPNVILDVPLLFESNLNEICDISIGIISDNKTKIERLKLRDKDNNISKRLNIQPKDEFYLKNADYIIENNDENLQKKIEEVWNNICIKHGKN